MACVDPATVVCCGSAPAGTAWSTPIPGTAIVRRRLGVAWPNPARAPASPNHHSPKSWSRGSVQSGFCPVPAPPAGPCCGPLARDRTEPSFIEPSFIEPSFIEPSFIREAGRHQLWSPPRWPASTRLPSCAAAAHRPGPHGRRPSPAPRSFDGGLLSLRPTQPGHPHRPITIARVLVPRLRSIRLLSRPGPTGWPMLRTACAGPHRTLIH